MNRATEVAEQLDMIGSKERTVNRDSVRTLMKDDDLEVLGVVYAFVTEGSRRIQPPLQFDELFHFITEYYTRCLKEDVSNTQWANTRYSAGHDLVNWFVILFNDKSIKESYVLNLRDWIAQLYREGDEELRTALVTATLEHLFEQKKIRKLFEEWKNDSILKPAYDQALQWVTRGGSTPLGKSKWLNRNRGSRDRT
jgi:hypothetical protein